MYNSIAMKNLSSGNRWQVRVIAALCTVALLICVPLLREEYNQIQPDSNDTIVLPARVASTIGRTTSPSDINYIAVGDSYTIGTGASPGTSWPADLASDLRAKGVKIEITDNMGVDGYTTQDAIDQELPDFEKLRPDFATLMIGANDTYRPGTAEQFRSQLLKLLGRMQNVLPNKRHIVLVTIPDYSVTPGGKGYSAMNNAKEKIVLYNEVIKDVGQERGLPVADICPLSRQMGKDPTLRGYGDLHPSAREYAIWERHIFPLVYRMLRHADTDDSHSKAKAVTSK